MTDLKRKILDAVQDDLDLIEKELVGNLNPYFDLVSSVAGHILFAGGKRLRPLLMVLCARLCGYDDQKMARISTIFEYFHAATLLHDDLVDGAELRRGRPVAHHKWDNPTAVLTGDFLLARGLSIAADTGSFQVIKTIAGITENMSQGEIRQLEKKGAIDLTEEEYMEVIRCKTAVLFQGASRIGALVAGANADVVQRMTDFGYHLGLAFQMADDLLDYTQDAAALGKHAGADIREGKLTLPLIHALANATPDHKEQMVDIIRRQDFSQEEFLELVKLLEHYGGIAYTRQLASRHTAEAKNLLLESFTPSETRRILLDIADYVTIRTS